MDLKVIDSGIKSADQNMEDDKQLLLTLNPIETAPVLHFYDWREPSATFGYFNSPLLQLNETAIKKFGLNLARRPTGGGIIFHQFDFAFSFLLPASHPQFSLNTLENYRLVNTIIADTIREYIDQHRIVNLSSLPLKLQPCMKKCADDSPVEKELRNFCMALPTVYDVVSGDFKLAGGAQRRTKLGFLHQASIALTLPPNNFLDEILGENSPIANAMRKHTFHLLGLDATVEEQRSTKISLKNLLIQNFSALS